MTREIKVTKTFLPPLEEYVNLLKPIWEKNWLTNNGPNLLKLESKLKKILKNENLLLVNNATLALQIALKTIEEKGEVITTPFSYVATTSSIVWEGFTPIFADIDPNTLCIDPKKIEEKITKKTKAIMATHVFGYPCDVEAISKIAKKYKLKVIYDAAHCFGVKYKNKWLANYGDISTISFHATKLFHTGEGGILLTNNKSTFHKMSYLRNFGHNGETAFWGLGTNAKMSELHATMGLAVLPHFKEILRKRKAVCKLYDKLIHWQIYKKPFWPKEFSYNWSYYPIVFPNETKLLKTIKLMNKHNIFPRRYFYPSLNNLPYVSKQACPISEDISSRILCLPLFDDLSQKEQEIIVSFL